jgi:hypothetical protein
MEAFYGNWAHSPQISADECRDQKLAANEREKRELKTEATLLL